MKYLKKYIVVCGVALVAMLCQSCEDYLEVDLQDQMSLEEVFSKRQTTERYLVHLYSFIPREFEYNGTGTGRGADGRVVPCSDEAMFSWYQWVYYLNFTEGNFSTSDNEYYKWSYFYQGINQACVFLNNVDACPEITEENKTIMKAEAQFLRAYCYFALFRQYGPVFIWGEKGENGKWIAKTPDSRIDPLDIDRNTVDDNVEFMVSEMDQAIANLPETIVDTQKWAGRITKGAAMAAKARLLLYAARPLFNGCSLYKGMKNHWGEYLFPQEPSIEKWRKAAEAAKAIIDMNQYKLVKVDDSTDKFENAIASYQAIYNKPWNDECIWGTYSNELAYYMRFSSQPPRLCTYGSGGFGPSLKMVDTYPMAVSGRYPVIGYDNEKPIVDELSGYEADGFTSNWIHPIEGKKYGGAKVHNSCKGRDARYYACVLANGFYWINNWINGGNATRVTFYTGGTSTYSATGDCNKVGFLWRRFLDPNLNTEKNTWGYLFWNYYRLGEVYLNYAEACIELGETAEALKYINLIRERVGLNKLEEAYSAAELADKENLRKLYAKERMCEMAWECDRWYYATQWMIAEKEFTSPNYTLNLFATNFEDSWQRTAQVWPMGDRKFWPKMYLHPIHSKELAECHNMTQNYGW